MTKTNAHQLLDSLKQGHSATLVEITRALWILGDVEDEPIGLYERSTKAPESFLGQFKEMTA